MFNYFMVIILSLGLFGCNQDSKQSARKIFTVKKINYQPNFNYSGTVRPRCFTIVTSPVNGHVEHIVASYGSKIVQGQTMLEVNDPQSNIDYVNIVVNFLENKEKLRKSKQKLLGETELYKAGVIAKNTLEDDQFSYDAAQVAFVRSMVELRDKAGLFGLNYKDITKLTLHDMKEIAASIEKNFLIKITANAQGRWMSPLLLDKNSKAELTSVYLGKKLEKGDVVGVIINGSCGVKIKFMVGQAEVNLLKSGMSAQITSKSLDKKLSFVGKITEVGYFNISTESSGETTKLLFPVEVVIDELPLNTSAVSLLGMQVKVKIKLPAKQQIRVPIAAVKIENNIASVKVVRANKAAVWVPVELGVAALDDVEIISGLAVGDQVVLQND